MSASRPSAARKSWARPNLGISDAFGALFSLAVASLSFLYPYGRDQSAFAYVAREWGLGNVPFKTVFEIKPPSIYLTYLCAFRIFGDHPSAIRLMDYFGAVVPTAIACAYASTPVREGPRPGRIGLALALVSVVYYLPFDFWSTAQCESFCSMFSVLAACAALRSERSMRAGFFVGLWSTMAVLFKPTVAIVAIGNALVLALALHSRKASRSDYLKASVAMVVGIVAPVVVLFAYFGAKGALGPMHEALVVTNRQYLLAGRYVHGAEETSRAVLFGIFGFQALLILCGNVLVFRGAHVFRTRPREEALPYLAAGVGLLASVASVIVQLKFFTYHWVSTVGFVAMTLVVVAGDLDRGRASRNRGAVLGAVVALALLVTGGRQSMRLFYTAKTAVHLAQTGDDEPLAKSFAIESYYSDAGLSREEILAQHKQTGDIDATTCKAYLDAGFLQADKKTPITVTIGTIESKHHTSCYRLYNLWREARAHKYVKGPAQAKLAPDWETLRKSAEVYSKAPAPPSSDGGVDASPPTEAGPFDAGPFDAGRD